VTNEGDASDTTPSQRSFFARVGGEVYDIALQPTLRQPDFRGDLEGIELYQADEIPAESERTGYLVFEVPTTARNDFQVGWSSRYSPDQVVYWV